MTRRGGLARTVWGAIGSVALVALGSCTTAPERPTVQPVSAPPVARRATPQPQREPQRTSFSYSGSLIQGGLVIGIVESLSGFYLPDGFKDTAPYIVVLVMLMVKPNGLFGEKLRKKV